MELLVLIKFSCILQVRLGSHATAQYHVPSVTFLGMGDFYYISHEVLMLSKLQQHTYICQGIFF